mgnify:CR=1 FL=1
MARVTLLFEDVDDTIAFRADYQGGLDPTSPAHKLANQVIKFLDDQAAKKQDIHVDTGPTDALQNGAGPVLWKPGDR